VVDRHLAANRALGVARGETPARSVSANGEVAKWRPVSSWQSPGSGVTQSASVSSIGGFAGSIGDMQVRSRQ